MKQTFNVNPRYCQQGELIRFAVLNNQGAQKTGRVVVLCDYTTAKAYADVAAIHQEMLQINPNLPRVEDMWFILVEQAGVRLPYGYSPTDQAATWFVNNTVERIDQERTRYISIADCSEAELYRAISMLQGAGMAGVKVARVDANGLIK